MVVTLGSGKFYGTSLPRPRLYTHVKLNMERVDPPSPVFDSLISWADEAHWSMGGRSSKRLRLQGRIEGNVQKLREQFEKRQESATPTDPADNCDGKPSGKKHSSRHPPAPFVRKRKLTLFVDGDEEDGDGESDREGERSAVRVRKGRRLVRKLKDDFDQVADEGVKEKGDGDLRYVKGKKSPSKVMAGNNGEKGKNATARAQRSMETESEWGRLSSPRLTKRKQLVPN